MKQLPRPIFDIYALSLPRGHAFGNRPPVEAWQSEDTLAWGAVTRDVKDRNFGTLVMRRREDHVWVTHTIDDGTLYFTVRFKDKTSFCLRYGCDMFVVGAELSDWQSGDFRIIREYMKPIPR